MGEFTDKDMQDFVQQARARKMRITVPGDADYALDARVHNSRIEYTPAAIAHCRDVDDVSWVISLVRKAGLPVTIRSGGHHHEAMCMNDGGFVLALDEINKVEVDPDERHVWVGAGRPLGEVIRELANHRRILPTGGCATVCVGGLTNGGGWGMSFRNLGLTVDKLREVEMVLPDGRKAHLDKDSYITLEGSPPVPAQDLFRAIRGGGGGNFGVVTRFRFELTEVPPVYCEFFLQWSRDAREDIALAWVKLCESDDPNLNIFARMTSVPDGAHLEQDPAFIVGGRYYGEQGECERALSDLIEMHEPELIRIRQILFNEPESYVNGLLLGASAPYLGSDGAPLPAQAWALQVGQTSKEAPEDTCIPCPEPHKVSSSMPKDNHAEIIRRAAHYLDHNPRLPNVNMYLSFHGLGGLGQYEPEGGTSFAWRKKPYMLQIQAWWWLDNNVAEGAVLDWVDGLKAELKDYTEGAFINFPDREQDVSVYYGEDGIFDFLKGVKAKVDPDNLLAFDMGIPVS